MTRTEDMIPGALHKRKDDARVLIMVDKYVPGANMEGILGGVGYNVIGICASGQEALDRLKKDKPNLVLTDILLHDCNGIEIVQQPESQMGNSNLYIYFTAHATNAMVQRTRTIPASSGCIVKPCNAGKPHHDFEQSFCQYYGIAPSQEHIMPLPVQPPIRVLLVNGHPIELSGLEKLIEGERPRMEVVGAADNGADARRLSREKQPDILLLDLCLGDEKDDDLIPDLVQDTNIRILIFTDAFDLEKVDRAVLSGARGVVHKKESAQTLLKAIEKIHAGELWLDRNATSRIFIELSRGAEKALPDLEAEKIATLTRKEREVVIAFAQESGAQNRQIAAMLCMGESTLRNHLTSIFSKLGVVNRFDLFMFAKRHCNQQGLINPQPEPPARDSSKPA
ncbi:MAG: DNA-binding response regulator [Nitrosomonas sp.]|nr:DNA-binding response regulator [Nitrosomonas sp.]MDP1950366.1 DNA-binding response regulator [Nitrosomonas sp.]